mmetsp:Transcript_109517/g.217485  ORF Transcript_109517/g.217485 Transcript_109517/m.217485 type:complete len:218 (-) Transcript_109517:971-1624(-)
MESAARRESAPAACNGDMANNCIATDCRAPLAINAKMAATSGSTTLSTLCTASMANTIALSPSRATICPRSGLVSVSSLSSTSNMSSPTLFASSLSWLHSSSASSLQRLRMANNSAVSNSAPPCWVPTSLLVSILATSTSAANARKCALFASTNAASPRCPTTSVMPSARRSWWSASASDIKTEDWQGIAKASPDMAAKLVPASMSAVASTSIIWCK